MPHASRSISTEFLSEGTAYGGIAIVHTSDLALRWNCSNSAGTASRGTISIIPSNIGQLPAGQYSSAILANSRRAACNSSNRRCNSASPATATGAAMNRLDGSDVEVMRPLVARLPKTTSACSLERASCWHSSAVLIAPARTSRRYTCSSVGVSPTASNIPDSLPPRGLMPCGSAKNEPPPTKPLQIDKTPRYQRTQALEYWLFHATVTNVPGARRATSTGACVCPE